MTGGRRVESVVVEHLEYYIYIKNLLISRDLVLSDLFWLLIFNMPQRTTIYQNIYRGTLSVLGIIDLSRSISNT